jgi:hypothetical protein
MKKLSWLNVFSILMVCKCAYALPFGSFDPRSLAMGGTGVASADANNAVFHNPALLAQYQYDEDEGRTSAFILPTITARVSNTVEEIDAFRQQDYDGQLSSAIGAFNANNGNLQSAQAVLDASLNLQDGLSRVSSGPVFADGNIAFVIAIPSLKQGGAFLFNKRFVGDGRITKSAEDEALLNTYVDAMLFLTGQSPTLPDNIDTVFDGNQLIDQTGNLNSSASAAGIALTELGLSMAGEFSIFKQNIALGITPKFVKAETYATESNATNDIDENRDTYNRWDITADVGIGKTLNKTWRVGMSIKNIVPLEYSTNVDNKIRIEPQVRAGAAYKTHWGTLAFDFDVMENDAVGTGDKSQYSLLGAEWDFKWGKLRGGFNYNFRASGPDKKGLFSGGVQFTPFGMILDLAYAENGVERAAALQMGFQF